MVTVINDLCPVCEGKLIKTQDSTFWCKKCKWNIVPSESVKPTNIFQKIYLSLSRKYGESMFNSLVNSSAEKLKPAITPAKIFAFTLSAVVYLLTVLSAILGIWLLIFHWKNIFTLIAAIVCLAITLVIRPRIPGLPKGILAREDFPALYEFIDSIAVNLNAKSVDGVVINGALNAGFGQSGLAHRKIIYIGLPLWKILSIEEKTALIAHELAHGINGDPLRGWFIGGALKSLINWYLILHPGRIWEPEKGLLGILVLPLNLVLIIFSKLVLLFANLLAKLIFIDSQKSEYFADYLATKVCGTNAMVSLLEKLLIGNKIFRTVLHKVSLRNTEGDLFDDLSKEISSLSSEEIENIKKISEFEESRVDSTHPPTFFRIRFLKHHFEAGIQIMPSADKIRLLDEEVFTMKNIAQGGILDKYKSSLYY